MLRVMLIIVNVVQETMLIDIENMVFLQPLDTPDRPLEVYWNWFPMWSSLYSKGYTVNMVVVDRFSKMIPFNSI